jgi:hypothetical protein
VFSNEFRKQPVQSQKSFRKPPVVSKIRWYSQEQVLEGRWKLYDEIYEKLSTPAALESSLRATSGFQKLFLILQAAFRKIGTIGYSSHRSSFKYQISNISGTAK